jgi:hypothetical protein
LVFGYGQTVYADIHSEFRIPEVGLMHFRFLPSPHKLTPAFDYRPEEILESAEIKFRTSEQEYSGTRRVIPKPFLYSRRLSFEHSPFPPCPWFPFPPPAEFVGYEAEAAGRSDGN